MATFITTGTFSRGTAINFYDNSITFDLAGLRGSSLYFLGELNAVLVAEKSGILDQAFVYAEYLLDVTARGGSGDDTLWGGAGINRFLGGLGEDKLIGGNGADMLDGGAQGDRLSGLGGADHLTGGADADLLLGGAGGDSLNGGSGADRLFGEADHDVLAGSGGADLLEGGSGDDDLSGGVGADRIIGGPGDDILSGRATQNEKGDGEQDEFVYWAENNGSDAIRAFEHGVDKIDVSALSIGDEGQQAVWFATHVSSIDAGRYSIELSSGTEAYGRIEVEVRLDMGLTQRDFLF